MARPWAPWGGPFHSLLGIMKDKYKRITKEHYGHIPITSVITSLGPWNLSLDKNKRIWFMSESSPSPFSTQIFNSGFSQYFQVRYTFLIYLLNLTCSQAGHMNMRWFPVSICSPHPLQVFVLLFAIRCVQYLRFPRLVHSCVYVVAVFLSYPATHRNPSIPLLVFLTSFYSCRIQPSVIAPPASLYFPS